MYVVPVLSHMLAAPAALRTLPGCLIYMTGMCVCVCVCVCVPDPDHTVQGGGAHTLFPPNRQRYCWLGPTGGTCTASAFQTTSLGNNPIFLMREKSPTRVSGAELHDPWYGLQSGEDSLGHLNILNGEKHTALHPEPSLALVASNRVKKA